MLQDLRIGFRMLLRQPAFTLIAVLTLAIGIGATAAVFNLIQGVLLNPPPYRQPEQLMLIQSARANGQKTEGRGWPAAQWLAWRSEAKSFESIAAYGWSFNFLVDSGGSESMQGMSVTRDYFRTLGMKPLMGRTFSETEAPDTATTNSPVIIIGYDLWQRKFRGDPAIIGKSLRMSRRDTPPRIIGVMPAGARFLPTPGASQEPNYDVNAAVDFWSPAAPRQEGLKRPGWEVVGRVRNGISQQAAQAELAGVVRREGDLERDFAGFTPHLQSVVDEMNRDGRRILFPLLGAAALVLLIACGNAAALLLVRGIQRQQEYAVRSALGVSRIALFRQASVESVLLAVIGCVLGIGLEVAAVAVFKKIGGNAVPRLDSVSTGWTVIICGIGAALPAALIAGLFPVFRALRFDPIHSLKSGGAKSTTGRAERRLLGGVAIFQTAMTLALLVCAGLLIRTMINLNNVRSGYETSRILTMSVTAVEGNWMDFHTRALARVSALPGVSGAAFAWGVPLTGNSWPGNVDIEGQPPAARPSDRTNIPLRAVTEDYFRILGLTISEGRAFRSTDTRGAPQVGIVNQAFADKYFPRGAVGKKIWLDDRPKPAMEIAGVVSNGKTADLTQNASPEIYMPLWQASAFSKHLVIRTAADPKSLMAVVQRELHAILPTASVEHVKTLEQIRTDSQSSRMFAMRLLTGFAVVGSVLTLVGIYGVLSLSVASRRREIAIRASVGAGQHTIRNMVLAEGFRLIAIGVGAGIAAAIIVSRLLRSFLFGVEANDPVTLAGVGGFFALVALLAFWVPARRAARVDPIEALRYE